MAGEDPNDFAATPPHPGNRPVIKKQERPMAPQESPHLKEGEQPVWVSCRASEACEGKYAVQTLSGEIDIDNGGGSWLRYKCLTCGGAFHIRR